jgi:hypothetical protein
MLPNAHHVDSQRCHFDSAETQRDKGLSKVTIEPINSWIYDYPLLAASDRIAFAGIAGGSPIRAPLTPRI